MGCGTERPCVVHPAHAFANDRGIGSIRAMKTTACRARRHNPMWIKHALFRQIA
jgi:hypothetical protein